MNKKCTKCKEVKSISMFYKDNSKKTNIRSCCKKCDDIYTVNWRKNNKDRYLATSRNRGRKNPSRLKANNIRSQKHRDEMSDMYIRSLITKKSTNLDTKDIPDDIVKAWRINLTLKRKLKKKPT